MHKTITKLTGTLLLCTMPVSAQAQFGGLGKMSKGALGGTSGNAGAVDTEAFLAGTLRSTKNVMIAAVALNYALDARLDKTSAKATIVSISGMQDIKEIGANKIELQSSLAALANNEKLADDVRARYEKGSAEEKKLLAVAVGNLAIGIARNVVLVKQAPDAMKSVTGNMAMLQRVGQFKLAGELVGIQAKGLAGIASQLPALLSAVKVKPPASPETTDPQMIAI